MIDFYNVQFYNQGSTSYDTYAKLFITSGGVFPKTSVAEIIANGIPSEKIALGKPAQRKDASNTGYVDCSTLGTYVAKAQKEIGWNTGVFFWQFKHDLDGSRMRAAAGALLNSDNTNDNTYDNTNDNTYDNTNDNTNDNRNDNTYDNTNDNTYDNTNDNTFEDIVFDNTEPTSLSDKYPLSLSYVVSISSPSPYTSLMS